MKRATSLLLLVALCLGVGCQHRLPRVKASEIHQTVSFPGFTSTVDASGINITEVNIHAADVQWRANVLGVSVITTAKDYIQRREKEEAP